MKVKRKSLLIVLLFSAVLGLGGKPLRVCAAQATVTFGSNWYNKASGDTFPVGVYLKAKQAIGDYHIEIKYDNLRMQYVDGADDADEENGVLTLEGNQKGREIKFWIRFTAISGGEAFIEVSSADVSLEGGTDGEKFIIADYDNAPVHIKGEDTAAVIEERMAEEERRMQEGQGIGGAGDESGAGSESAEPGQNGIREGSEDGEDENGVGGNHESHRENGAGGGVVAGQTDDSEGSRESAGNASAYGGTGREDGEGLTGTANEGSESSGIKEDVTNRENGAGQSADAGSGNEIKPSKRSSIIFNVYVVILLVVILVAVIVDVVVWNIIKRARAGKAVKEQGDSQDVGEDGFEAGSEEEFGPVDLDNLAEDEKQVPRITAYEEELEWQFGRPIIKVCDVTMEFRLSSVNPSGLKEYLVQLLKREVSYRKLYALYHVSFNVYKGEVIGIIGTNGSGKSTLLKIVSGALKPTEGYVDVGRRKIQLLTLGTGFDMELTARENVFLNGSIIGYRREFLEEHYEEIVEFAELGDFMEEKVKNFSSGMVSRLGFAIATAGDAADILILDEVLSVGDEFFRQKSLKRIKEMIHGGSTVLLVSHSMATILDNCSRCVWIEKGELRMVGEPKVVCEEYRRMNG